MRTTLTLDDDVAAKAKLATMQSGMPFKVVINQALRVGIAEILAPQPAQPYRTRPHPMGLKAGLSYDNVQELLSVAEGETHG